MDFEKIRRIAEKQLADKKSYPWAETGNKYFHGQRVAKSALTLRHALFPNDSSSDYILTVAAWFHDIKNGEAEHGAKGASLTAELLSPYIPPAELHDICELIRYHDDRNGESDSSLFTDTCRVLQDADCLDHFGSYSIGAVIIKDYIRGENINTMAKSLTASPEYAKKYLERMNFELSRKILSEKIQFQIEFAERFARETDGEYCLPEIKNQVNK